MRRHQLYDKTFNMLDNMRLAIENNPDNKNAAGSFHIYKPYPRKKLEDIAWAITVKLERGDTQ